MKARGKKETKGRGRAGERQRLVSYLRQKDSRGETKNIKTMGYPWEQ